jgi:Uma2 family endonuclease
MASVETSLDTLADLAKVDGKAELIGGHIVRFMPTRRRPGRIAGRIYRSLDDYAERTKLGEAFPDNVGYAVPRLSSGRQSFAPDASFVRGPLTGDVMRFVNGPPTVAVEVRSESGQTERAEQDAVEKRLDYFEAGTPLVWDVDPIAETVTVYRSGNDEPRTYSRGETIFLSELPDYSVAVDWLFQ